ncbi:hypothetical protein [Streptomyces sp. NRRL B-24484]|uniref:hypothetical protein n=1 Tax=Streptomyces sp. NRRL B-24484 TaxID=1463833 RepID=UPI0004BEB2E8|nr:hypothetical protein [Streptomyces sp. NRRL B-24484]
MTPVERLTSRARHGRHREVLPELLALATDPAAPPDPAWEAGAAAVQILCWEDRFAEAGELAALLIERQGPGGGDLCDQDMPFDDAFLAVQLYAGVPAQPRLRAAADHVPEGRVLQDRLLWLAEQLDVRPVESLLPCHYDWGGPLRPRDGVIGEWLLDRDFTALEPRDKPVAWEAIAKTNDFARGRELVESLGELPDQYYLCLWLAGWYAVEGDVAGGERMLLAAHTRWWPYTRWDVIPTSEVLQPTLRQVVTDEVRQHYLTEPAGPEASGGPS